VDNVRESDAQVAQAGEECEVTITVDEYINRVLAAMPRQMPTRSQIAMELRGHISERVAHGDPLDEVLRRLGDPVMLAESYLAAEPLVPASFRARVAAKLVDVLIVLVAVSPLALLGWRSLGLVVVGVALIAASFAFGLYTIAAEYVAGDTVGKRLMGLRVVRESGSRIGLGQAIVRQLPMFLQVYMIDVCFALFTERHQRAFELLSKTRVVTRPVS
jgi:uncharacterized RDD family membrane protein YckC